MKINLITSFVLVWLASANSANAQDTAAGRAQSLTQQGIAAHDRRDYAQAIELYTRAIAQDARCWDAYYERAYSYYAMGNRFKALEEAKALYENNQASTNSRESAGVLVGSLLDQMGRGTDAVAHYKKMVKRYSNSHSVWFNYAVSLFGQQQNDEGFEAALKALHIKPTHPGSHRLLAAVMVDSRSYAGGILAATTFLMYEARGERAAQVAQMVGQSTQRVLQRQGTNVEIIAAPPGPAATAFGPLQLMWALALAGQSSDTAQTAINAKPQLVQRLEALYEATRALPNNSDKLWKFYGEMIRAVVKAGHGEALAYLIAMRAEPENQAILDWVEASQDKLSRLAEFMRAYAWPSN
jgi:tetratricopeptide (TPR) repeat protein